MVVWDFNEIKNYKLVDGYKVLDLPDAKKASKLLNEINKLILEAFISIELTPNKTPEIVLLLNTPFYLQEMQLIKDQGEIKFDGLNKPKEVHPTGMKKIGEDGNLRAKHRRIFLTLRDNNGKLKNLENLKPLIIHELAHTALNHVTWRDDDHPKKFYRYFDIIEKHTK
jgi:hypothetical protein